jgi:DNA-binding sugar fermentation-stimulating protein
MRFLVISHDADQQKWYYDFVVAQSEQAAVQCVCMERPSVIAADALSAETLCNLAAAAQLRNRRDLESACWPC